MHEAQICDLLNESGIWMREWVVKPYEPLIKAQMCDLLNESGIRMREMGCETI